MRKTLHWIGFVVFLLVSVYGAVGVVHSTWLSATPNYPKERAEVQAYIWIAVCVTFFLGAILSLLRAVKTKK